MSSKNKKQFGIWMDAQQAIIVGRDQTEEGDFVVLAHEKSSSQGRNSSENAANNSERTLQQKYFKEILGHLQNATELHVTGTGQVQEQLIKYMGETPQFKNTKTGESTASQMSEEKLVAFFTKTFN